MGGSVLERRRVDLGSVSLTYGHAGTGPPLVLIHGLAGSSRWWEKNVGPLSEHFALYAVDLVGFGESRSRQRFSLTASAGHLAELLERLEVGPAGVIGHSMGGYIAAELAATVPDRVSRLVLVAAAVLPPGFVSPRQALRLVQVARFLPVRFLPTMVADAYRSGPATIGGARELLAADLRPQLGRIEAPTLIVWGERDAIVPLDVGRQLVRDLPRAELSIIPEAGHLPMWERPDAFNRVVSSFLTAPPETRDRLDD